LKLGTLPLRGLKMRNPDKFRQLCAASGKISSYWTRLLAACNPCPDTNYYFKLSGALFRWTAGAAIPTWIVLQGGLGYFHQQAGYVVVLRCRADEGVEVAHHAAKQFVRSGRYPGVQDVQ
jgi:hypothetical protein